MSTSVYALLFLSACSSFVACAETLNCGNDFVQLGENKAAVVLKCGEPQYKDSFCQPDRKAVAAACETIDLWTYQPGSGQFVTTLKFASGKVVAIEYGERIP